MKRQNVFTVLWKKTCDSLRALFSGPFVFMAIQLVFERTQVFASAQVAQTCDRVARIASSETGIPLNVLRAITQTKTVRNANGKLRPWPWTANMEGKGVWFNSHQEATVPVWQAETKH